MSDTQHTPGPWVLDDFHHAPSRKKIVSADYHYVDAGKGFYPKGFGLSLVASEADARLIASAPELLEALVKIRGWREIDREDLLQEIENIADAAIAKAKGESK